RTLVKNYIQKLLDDWTRGTPRDFRAVQIFGEVTRFRGPFDDDPPGCRLYLITLEDHAKRRRTGWLRLGSGWVDSQLVRQNGAKRLPREIKNETDLVKASRAVRASGSARLSPMWDHWLDA